MTDEPLAKVTTYLKNMPSLPVTVAKVLQICDTPNTRPADLNRIIMLDPVLVGRLIKLVNSAYFGGGGNRRIQNLARAIIMLGINTVKNMALSAAILAAIDPAKKNEGLIVEGFWRHSLGVAVAARLIARERGVGIQAQGEYFTAGLLHDIGKLPMNSVLARDYLLPIAAADRNRISLYRAEKEHCGIDHTEAGNIIAQTWNLYGAVGEAITWHHNYLEYDGEHKDVLYTVVMANWFITTSEIGFAGDRHPEKIPPKIWQYLKPDDEIFTIIKPLVNGEIEKASLFLGL
jgi:HD-like signal output (HDOD) protein